MSKRTRQKETTKVTTPYHRFAVRIAVLALGLLALGIPAATASAAPAWKLTMSSSPTNFMPGQTVAGVARLPNYSIIATNVGGHATVDPGPDGKYDTPDDEAPVPVPTTITATLPAGLTPVIAEAMTAKLDKAVFTSSLCEIDGQEVTCTTPDAIPPGGRFHVRIGVNVAALADPTLIDATATISGGAATPSSAATTTTVTSSPVAFDFLPDEAGLSARINEEDGTSATAAGSHPHRLTIDLGLTTEQIGVASLFGVDGGLRDATVALPRGLVVNPNATSVLCTEAQLESVAAGVGCPDASQVGTITTVARAGLDVTADSVGLYNMVPTPGVAAQFGFDAIGLGIFTHIDGGVRAGDYALEADTNDILAIALNPLLGARTQLWGDPSSPSHDAMRGRCSFDTEDNSCPVTPQDKPLLTMPTSCTDALSLDAEAASWGHPDDFVEQSAEFTDFNGNPTGTFGCNALQFDPTLQARPTTNAADSPTGLDVSLKVPQTNSHDTLATAHLRKAVVTLPEGLVVNPASANGLAGCSSDQIGLTSAIGATPIRFDGDKPACPNASRIGRVEVETALLGHPLPGSVYVATPGDNPFGSLLAIYVVIDDPKSGIVVKLAGHVQADPQTGRLTTTFDENPQLPFDEFKLDFFGGATAALRTPATCGSYSTTSSLTPWSAPDSGPPATPKDDYAISQGPGGGSCATSPGAQPHSPAFDAGSVSAIAGAFTPFVLNLRREEGSQHFASLNLSPPPGLLGKLAGTASCSDTALAVAATKSGNQEKQSPSCPPASEVGNVVVGAGAGPAPYYATGKAYIAGPYKGAPLSLAVITPAVAGPYDLGTVVVRTALHVDPRTTQLRAVSDPLPQILEGIVLDVRSIRIAMDRPQFTLNPTNCDPMAVNGELFSSLGQLAPLENRFQLAECDRLGFKPKLSFRLKGGTKRGDNPKLIANLKARPGDANVAAAQVTLPRSAFLDQAHIRTICTRVQWAQDACPQGSIYGTASARSPLLDYSVAGNVYLRSSDNPLPDLIADLRGPAHQPLRVELVGRTDSVKGALRNTFDLVPDAPVSTFHLELFGGKRGLVVNSQNLCARANRAKVQMDAQNGREYEARPVVKNSCKGKGRRSKR